MEYVGTRKMLYYKINKYSTYKEDVFDKRKLDIKQCAVIRNFDS